MARPGLTRSWVRRCENAASMASAAHTPSNGSASAAPWKLPPDKISLVAGEHQRVVGHARDLDGHGRAGSGDRLADSAVYLGHAAQRVRVLAALRAADQRALGQQAAHVSGHLDCAGVGPRRDQPGVVGRGEAEQGLEAQRRDLVGTVSQPLGGADHVEGEEPVRMRGRWSVRRLPWLRGGTAASRTRLPAAAARPPTPRPRRPRQARADRSV